MSAPQQPPGSYAPGQYPQQQGYPQQGYPQQGQPQQGQWQAAQRRPGVPGQSMIWLLGLISVACVVIGLSVSEDGRNAWDTVNAWGGLAIAGAVLSAAGAFGPMFNLAAPRAARISLVGAGALALFWVLLVLPAVGSNTSLVTTIGVLAGVGAAWQAQPGPAGAPGTHTW